MNRLLHHPRRLGLCAAVYVLLMACAWKFSREPVEQALADYSECRHWQHVLEKAQERGQGLDERVENQQARVRAKARICRDLIDGRLCLLEAARQVANLPYPPRSLLDELRKSEKGATDQERWCRHVIDCACNLVESEPTQADALRRRLEAELQVILNQPQDK